MADDNIKKLKYKIYRECMKYPAVSCEGNKCPIFHVMDDCHKQMRRDWEPENK